MTELRDVTWNALIAREITIPVEGATPATHALRRRWADRTPEMPAGQPIGMVLTHELAVQGIDDQQVLSCMRAIVSADVYFGALHGYDYIETPHAAEPEDQKVFDFATREVARFLLEVPEIARITLTVKKTDKVLTFTPEPR